MDDFFKFPSTPHLGVLGANEIRADKCLTPTERHAFLSHDLVVEEKVDGANLGISFDARGNVVFQNRGGLILEPYGGQWKGLGNWIARYVDGLFDMLGDRLILFGEWCYARHSISYTKLPDWFLAFDVYDRQRKRFFSVARRDAIVSAVGLTSVARVGVGRYTYDQLAGLSFISHFGTEPAEGLYFRVEDEDWLVDRAKLVRARFRQAIEEHWTRNGLVANRLLSMSRVVV